MTFRYGSGFGSGSSDPYLGHPDLDGDIDPDPSVEPDPAPDPALFVSDLVIFKMPAKNHFISPSFICFFLFEGTFTSFFKDKK